jgi:RNA polymerase sigma-70 factor, ECF subfamily
MGQDAFSNQVQECCQRLAAKGAIALGGLFDLTSVRLVRFATTITRNQHDAEDVVQSVLLAASQKASTLAGADNSWHYLLRMVRNESLVVLRKRKRWSIGLGILDLLTVRRVDQLEREDQFRAIWLALRTLPQEQSEVVVLKIWEELTFQEIADLLGVSLSTVASRYRYALEKLSSKLVKVSEEVSHDRT